jgi:hypothetical protein
VKRKNSTLKSVVFSCLGLISSSLVPVWADDLPKASDDAGSGWPSLPPPSPIDFGSLSKTDTSKSANPSGQYNSDSVPAGDAKSGSSNRSQSSSQTSSGTDKAACISPTGNNLNTVKQSSDLSAVEQMRLQNALDRKSKLLESTSDIVKKQTETESTIINNLK